MANYHLTKKGELKELPDTSFCEELEMQSIVENNIETLLGLQFIADEFTVLNRRFDTVAFDFKKKSFVILEYKKVVKDSVTDQGVAYWNLIQNNKATMVDLYNMWANQYEMDNVTEDDINWKEVNISLVAPGYTKYQQEAFLSDERIDLYVMYRVGKTNTLHFQQIENEIPIKNVNYNKALSKVKMMPPTKAQKEMLKTRKEKELEEKISKDEVCTLYYGRFIARYFNFVTYQDGSDVDWEYKTEAENMTYSWYKTDFLKFFRNEDECYLLLRVENLKMFKNEKRLVLQSEEDNVAWYKLTIKNYSDFEKYEWILRRSYDYVFDEHKKVEKESRKNTHY